MIVRTLLHKIARNGVRLKIGKPRLMALSPSGFATSADESSNRALRLMPIVLMNEVDARQELEHLNAEINTHDKLYYHDGRQSISDPAYDKLVRRAEDIVGRFLGLSGIVEKLTRVGHAASEHLPPFVHSQRLLSLANAFGEREVEAFLEKVTLKLEKEEIPKRPTFVVEPKIDGVSLALQYRQGKLVGAGTRGNGSVGEDVTSTAVRIRDIPTSVPRADWAALGLGSSDGNFEVRGEVHISKQDFAAMNAHRASEDRPPLSTARNATAGLLRQLSSADEDCKLLSFFAYSLFDASAEGTMQDESEVLPAAFSSQVDSLQSLQKLGFRVAEPVVHSAEPSDILEACRLMEEQQHSLAFEADGAVVKVDSTSAQRALGSVSRYPNWAVAFKFESEEYETVLLSIEAQIGRTGVLTPVAALKPVKIQGVTVTHASLHSEKEVGALGLQPGCTVRVKRSGGVIPKVVGRDTSAGEITDLRDQYRLPAACPACGTSTVREEGGTIVRCPGGHSCSAQVVEMIRHYCSRDAADIAGFGRSKIKELHSMGVLSSVAEIYKLRGVDLANNFDPAACNVGSSTSLRKRKGWGDRSVNNLLSAIDSRRSISFERFLFGLGIRHVGAEAARALASHFGNFPAFWNHVKTEGAVGVVDPGHRLLSIPGIGPKAVESILDTARDERSASIVEELLTEVEVEVTDTAAPKISQNAAKTIVFTGKLPSLSRKKAEELSRRLRSAEVASRVTRDTDILITGPEDQLRGRASAKLKKAQELESVQIWTEKEFLEWINDSNEAIP